MVVGLDTLKKYFAGFEKHYTIIGGTACEIKLEGQGVPFRATKDIDMLLIIEALDNDFLKQFWQFIKDGEYQERQFEQGERKFFRFIKPKQENFPIIVELFSRKPETIALPEGFHLTPIPTDEEISSLSAMLLHDDYYEFTIKNSSNDDGLTIANEPALLCLKVKAYLNNKKRKDDGHAVRTEDIEKHKKDVLKLAATLAGTYDVSPQIKDDLKNYIQTVKSENPDVAAIIKDLGLGTTSLTDLLDLIENTFILKE
jgi:hypothetical protein